MCGSKRLRREELPNRWIWEEAERACDELGVSSRCELQHEDARCGSSLLQFRDFEPGVPIHDP